MALSDTLFPRAVEAIARKDYAAATDLLVRILEREPEHWPSLHNVGAILVQFGENARAVPFLERALAAGSTDATTDAVLATALMRLGQMPRALDHIERAVRRQPDFIPWRLQWSAFLYTAREYERCLRITEECLAMGSREPILTLNRGLCLAQLGSPHEAETVLREAMSLRGAFDWEAEQALLFQLRMMPGCSGEEFGRLARAWASRVSVTDGIARPVRPVRREPPYRIGYVSGDFYDHPVSRFLLKVLAHHDRDLFQPVGFSNSSSRDEITDVIEGLCPVWPIHDRSDREVRELVEREEIDVLVDLSGMSARNRLSVFAGRAAPVQVTWLGFNATTGLPTMDWIVADEVFIAPGEEAWYSERPLRLRGGVYCFDEWERVPPRPRTGPIVFACFNHLDRWSRPMAETWAEVLRRVPDAEFVARCYGFRFEEGRRKAAGLLEEAGMPMDRCRLEEPLPRPFHLLELARVDIILDTFPTSGGTTTAEALWNGLPVVTLPSDRFVGRTSASLLTVLGKTDWIARSREDFVAIACRLARDRRALEEIRQRLPEEMRASPLIDGRRFTESFEEGLREAIEASRSREAA